MTEEWRPVQIGKFHTATHYEVSNRGRVRNHETGRVLAQYVVHSRVGSDYLKVNLWRGGVRFPRYVHRLVAIAFIANPDKKPEVNHGDTNTLNNEADNLEWSTRAENEAHKKFMEATA